MDNSHYELIEKIINNEVEKILETGTVIKGHNGPYYDEEREGRNISHWIVICSLYWEKTHIEKYYKAVERLAEYYYSKKDISDAGVYYCREGENKDNINGTIGQAWIIEGLIAAAKTLKSSELYEMAVNLFKKQKFNYLNGMWERIEVNGENLGIDITYNHQLWFAAAGCEIIECKFDKEIDEMITIFLEKSNKTFWVMHNGVICHFANIKKDKINTIKNYIKYIKHTIEILFNIKSLEYKEKGYHLFNMYGFAILQDRYSNNNFFKSKKFKRALNYTFNNKFIDSLESACEDKDVTRLKSKNVQKNINKYSYPYNSPAFELPYVMKKFKIKDENNLCYRLMKFQIDNTYDNITCTFNRNTEDSTVLTARLYELIRGIL